MSRFYKTSRNQPINFGYELPYKEMLQGLAAKQQQQDLAQASVGKLETATQSLAFLKKDEDIAEEGLNNVTAQADSFSNMDLTDPRNKQKLNQFSRQTAKDFGQFGKYGKVQANYNAFQSYNKDLKARLIKGKITQNEYNRSVGKSLGDYKGVGEEGDYNSFSGFNPSDHVEVNQLVRDEFIKIEKDVRDNRHTERAGLYFKDNVDYAKWTPEERMQAVFKGIMKQSNVQNYLQSASQLGTEPGLNEDPEAYLQGVYNQAASTLGTEIKDYDTLRADSSAVAMWKAQQAAKKELAKFDSGFITTAYGNQAKLPKISSKLSNIDSIINEGEYESGTGYRTVEGGKVASHQIAQPQMKAVNTIADLPEGLAGPVKTYYDTLGIDSDNLSKEQINVALEDYKTKLTAQELANNEIYAIPHAFKEEVTKSVFGDGKTAGTLNVTQDAVFIDEDTGQVININDKSAAARILRGAQHGADDYQLSIDGIDSKGGFGHKTGGALSGTIIYKNKRYTVKLPIKDTRVQQSLIPLNSYSELNSPLGTSEPQAVWTASTGRYEQYVSEPVYINIPTATGQKQILSKKIYMLGEDGEKIPVDNSPALLEGLKIQAERVRNNVVPQIGRQVMLSSDKTTVRK